MVGHHPSYNSSSTVHFGDMEKELKSILEAEHLEHLAPKFEEQGVTDEILDQLLDSDLRELGVEKLGERKRLLSAFTQHRDIPLSGTVMVTVGGGVMPTDSELCGLRIEEFEVGKYPVMQEEWEWVRLWALAKDYELESGHATGSSHPVTHVSWYDAVKWCNAKSEHEGLSPTYECEGSIYRKGEFGPSGSSLITYNIKSDGYRLLSEAEWEWAAWCGILYQKNQEEQQDKDVSLSARVLDPYYSELGIYNMTSNVWEWCWDQEADSQGAHRIRSGIWSEVTGTMKGQSRVSRSPDSRLSILGFRLGQNA